MKAPVARTPHGDHKTESVGGRPGGDLAALGHYEREVASLDLYDAEQAACHPVPELDRAAELYARADRHRWIAERLEAGDASVMMQDPAAIKLFSLR